MARPTASNLGPGPLRAAWYLLGDAADTCEMLIVSLLTGGAAMAAACALASLIVWLARTAREAVVRA
jgi:hypothetical protein